MLDNDTEVRLLEALRGESGARDRLWALAAALDAGVVEAGRLRKVNGRVSEIAAVERPEDLWRVRVPADLRAAVAYVSVCMNDPMLLRWLGFALAARLEANLVRGLLPGPGWVSWHVPMRQRRWVTWDLDTHWMSELPAEFWSRLAGHSDARLQAAAAASDPATRPKVLERLADEFHGVAEVLDLVACNPRTPARVLRFLGRRSWGWPRTDLRVAQNHAAAAGLLGGLARRPDWELRYVAAWNPKIPVSALRRLAGDESAAVRAAAARSVSAPPEVLETLASDPDTWVRRNAGWNPSTPTTVLEVLSGDRLAVVRAAAVSNANTPTECAAGRVRDRALGVRCQIAERRGIASEVLAVLAGDPKDKVRRAVALNERTPPEILDRLAVDSSVDVRAAVAYNAGASPETLTVLAADNDGWPRCGVAQNPATPPELLVVLADDPDSGVNIGVAQNPATPVELLAALAADDDPGVRGGAALNPAASTELLEVLAQDPDAWVRRLLCDNDNAPEPLVAALRTDPNFWVRDSAVAACERRGAQTPPGPR